MHLDEVFSYPYSDAFFDELAAAGVSKLWVFLYDFFYYVYEFLRYAYGVVGYDGVQPSFQHGYFLFIFNCF